MTNGEKLSSELSRRYIATLPQTLIMALDQSVLERLKEDVKCATMKAMATLTQRVGQ